MPLSLSTIGVGTTAGDGTGDTAREGGIKINDNFSSIQTLVNANETKLATIETNADVTDTANVTAAGALMDSEVTNLAAVKAFDPTDYATAAQGSTADTAVQPGDDAADLGSAAATDGWVLTADGAGGAAWEASAGGGGTPAGSSGDIQYNNAGSFGGSILKQGTNAIEQRNSTTGQSFRVFNTYTDASNYEAGIFEWNTNALRIGTDKAGTGASRDILIYAGGTQRLSISASNGFIDWSSKVGFKYVGATVYLDGAAYVLRNYAGTGNTSLQINGYTLLGAGYTVATLPTAAVGMQARVTDASAPAVGSTVTGGGAAAALVWYNGSNWTVIGV